MELGVFLKLLTRALESYRITLRDREYKTMPVAYQKICCLCLRNFYTMRINTAFCSKSCRNRARYLPPHLKAQLLRRSSQYAMTATRYQNTMIENNGAINSDTFGDLDSTQELTARQIQELKLVALEHQMKGNTLENPVKEHGTVKIIRGNKVANTIASDVPMDMEAVKLNLDEKNDKYTNIKGSRGLSVKIDVDNSLPDPDDDGLGVVNEIAKEQAKPTFGVDQQDNSKQNDKVNLSSVVPQTNENDLSLSNIRRGIRKLGGSK